MILFVEDGLGSTPWCLSLPNFHTHRKSMDFPHWFILGPRALPFPKTDKSLLLCHALFASIGSYSLEMNARSVGMIATLNQSLLTSHYEDLTVYFVLAFCLAAMLHWAHLW